MSESDNLKKLNIGCGGKVLPGAWVNLDKYEYPHVDILYDLESGARMKMNGEVVPDNTFDRMLMSHVFEHIHNPLPMMQELWRVAKPGCKLAIITPFGSSDNAWEDPTHVRPVFADTYQYFSQAYYHTNDYGYRGDWDFNRRVFIVNRDFFRDDATDQMIGYAIQHWRNIVVEFQCQLVAIKPIRKHPFDYDTPQTVFKFT